MIRRLVDALKSILAPHVGGAVPVGQWPPTEDEKQVSNARPSQEEVFDSKLEALADSNDSESAQLVAGSLQLVGLDDVREAMGDRWQAIGRKAVEIAEAELQRQLEDADFYRYSSDTSFLVCFSNLDQVAADRKARHIGSRLKARLAEQIPEFGHVISIDHFVAAVDRAKLREGGLPMGDRLYGTLERMREEALAAARLFRSSLLRNFQVKFSPVWHTTKHIAVLNRCLLDMASGCTTLAQFRALADPHQLVRTLAELDFLLLSKSLEALHQMLLSKQSTTFMVPVAFKTVAEPDSFREYARLLGLLPESYRKFLVLEICGIPDMAQADRLGRLVAMLSGLAEGLALEVNLDDSRLGALVAQAPWALSVNLAGASSIDPQLPGRLRRFTAAVTSPGIRTYAHGANSIGLALAALEAGFTYLDGPAIPCPFEGAQAVAPLIPLPSSATPARIATRW